MTVATQAPVKVPWSKSQEDHLRSLAEITDHERWDIGDEALKAIPMGEVPGSRNQSKHFIRLLAQRIGVEPNTLSNLRVVAHAWPADLRRLAGTWNAHKAYTTGGPKKAEERGQLFDRIAADPETPFGKVTAPLVKQHKPVKTKLSTGQTKTDRRRAAAHRAIEELREISPDHLSPEDRERVQHVVGILAQIERGDL